jgi:uncharacterized protein (TIGR04255 family)
MTSPFDAVEEVPLSDPPIVRALVQLRFAPVLSLFEDRHLASFQEQVRTAYPYFAKQRASQLQIGPDGVTEVGGEDLCQFSSADDWSLTLATSFITLSAARYTSRSEVTTRLAAAVTALSAVVGSETPWTRLGARYINRLSGEDFERVGEYVTPHAQGGHAISLPPGVSLGHSLTEAHFAIGPASGLTLRWGVLPPGVSVTPDVTAADTVSWILDADAFSMEGGTLDPAALQIETSNLCDITYRAFRWAATDALLRARGGNL